MRTRWIGLLVVLIILGGAGYLAHYLTRPELSDREQIQRRILEGAWAIEERRVSRLMRVVADDYDDGLYTKREIEQLARGGVLQGEEIRVVTYLKSIDLQGNLATTEVEAEVSLGPLTNPVATGRYQVTLHWRKGEHGWQAIRGEGWQSAPAELGGY